MSGLLTIFKHAIIDICGTPLTLEWSCLHRTIKYKGWIKTPECIHCPLVAHTRTSNSPPENMISINRIFSCQTDSMATFDLSTASGDDATATTLWRHQQLWLCKAPVQPCSAGLKRVRRQQRRHDVHPKHLKSAGHSRRLWSHSDVKPENWNEF